MFRERSITPHRKINDAVAHRGGLRSDQVTMFARE